MSSCDRTESSSSILLYYESIHHPPARGATRAPVAMAMLLADDLRAFLRDLGDTPTR